MNYYVSADGRLVRVTPTGGGVVIEASYSSTFGGSI